MLLCEPITVRFPKPLDPGRSRMPEHRILDIVDLPTLVDWVRDARQRTFELVSDLTDDQLMGPKLGCVNPARWEIGHHAWFQSFWVLRHAAGQRAPGRTSPSAAERTPPPPGWHAASPPSLFALLQQGISQ